MRSSHVNPFAPSPRSAVPSVGRAQQAARRLAPAATLAQAALIAFLAACADAPTTPAARSTPAGGPVAGEMSRNAPIPGPMSMRAPAGPMPAGPSASFGEATAALRVPTAEAQPNALVTGNHLVWQNTTTGERSMWIMNGPQYANQAVLLPTVPTAWQIAAAADFSGDGQTDLLWQNLQTGERSIWIMSGTTYPNSFALLPTVPTQWRIAGAGDFNADGNADIVWQNTQTGERSLWLMSRTSYTGNFALLPTVPVQWSIAAVEDFNADNKPDLVWQNTTTGERSIWFMNGAAYSNTAALLPTIATQWSIVAAADFTSDGKADLVWQNTQTGERSIWFMNGATWPGQYQLLPTVPTSWSIATAANFSASSIPLTPTSVGPAQFTSSSPTQITLNWTRASTNETVTLIERAPWASSQNPGTPVQWSQVTTLGAGASSYTDANGLSPATRYIYRLSACNNVGCSNYTAPAAAETGPTAYTTLALGTAITGQTAAQGSSRWFTITVPAGRTSLTVATSGNGDADLYVMFGAPSGTVACSLATPNTSNESCTVTNPQGGTYYVRVFGNKLFDNVSITAN